MNKKKEDEPRVTMSLLSKQVPRIADKIITLLNDEEKLNTHDSEFVLYILWRWYCRASDLNINQSAADILSENYWVMRRENEYSPGYG